MGPKTSAEASASSRRRRAFGALAPAMLALHAALLWALRPDERPPGAVPTALRTVVALRVPEAPPAPAARSAAAGRTEPAADPGAPAGAATERSPGRSDSPRPPDPRWSVRRPAAPQAPASRGASSGAVAAHRERAARVAPESTAGGAVREAASTANPAMPAPASGDAPIPVYATRLPPPLRLRFEVRRGGAAGSAELAWLRRDDDYELSLAGELLGRPILEAASRGSFDAAGVAPVRHVERRGARDVRAVNFQRDAGIVTFSGPRVEHALVAGAQDRLSWLIQLPAIVAADPVALGVAGAQVTMLVVGARGDAEAWRFDAEARETLGLADGSAAETLRFARQPSRPYDRRVEVWLDPSRGWLPVRLRFTPVPGGDATELRLLAAEPAG